MKINYKLQDRIDFAIILPALALMIIGLLAIYSSTFNHPTASGNFQKQFFWSLASVFVFILFYFVPEQTFKWLAIPSYVLSVVFLMAVVFIGKTVYGSQSWLALGPIGFQPSEFAKIALILVLSYWLTYKKRDINNLKDLGIALLLGVFLILLILMQPDMGTAIVFILITLVMIFWRGISLFGLFVVLSPAVVVFSSLFGLAAFLFTLGLVLAGLFFFKRNLFSSVTVFVINLAAGFIFDFAFHLLRPHQQRRIETFVDPASDPLGSGYNAMQAKVAIGSGGLLGKGFLEGNQTQLRFIPQQWTDFIYCVIGEEFGFIGSVIVIILFLIIFIRLLNLSSVIKDDFHSMVIIGFLTLLFVHFAINVGMNIGVTPVIGLPLPFLSYGGSALMVNMVLLGMTLNIYKNRKSHA
ncbi:MAG: rod shape-determining protein RodA [bacterium]